MPAGTGSASPSVRVSFSEREIRILAEWARDPDAARYADLERCGFTRSQIQFAREQIRSVYETGSWCGDERPPELEDFLAELRLLGVRGSGVPMKGGLKAAAHPAEG